MTRREDLDRDIANLEAILNASATSVSEDGQTTSFDLDQARARLVELRSERARLAGKKEARPLFGVIDLSGRD